MMIPTEKDAQLSKITLMDNSGNLSQFKHICFIDSAVENFSAFLNSETYPVIYEVNSDREALKTSLLQHFTQIDRVSFVFHGPPDQSAFTPKRFIHNEPFFAGEVPNNNQTFLQDLFTSLHVKNVDFLACNLLQQQEWKDYFASFENVVVGASLDATGNVKYGGNWVMENTMENVRDLYFNPAIENFAALLATYLYTDVNNRTYTFTFTVSGVNATITSGDRLNPLSGVIIIPETVTSSGNTYSVTSIGYEAFVKYDSLHSGVSGASFGVTYYNRVANPHLRSVVIGNSVTSIATDAFYFCTGLTSVVIGNSVKSIGTGAFYGCTRLTSVNIPNSVTSIGVQAFYGCTGLTSVVIGNSVTSIGQQAFYGCTGLKSVVIPNNVTSIATDAFQSCTSLTSVVIGNSVKSIGSQAFANCRGLTSVVIPNSVTSIGDSAFYDCSAVTSVYYAGNTLPTIATEDQFTNPQEISYYLSTASNPTNLTSKQTIGTNTPIAAEAMVTKLLAAGYTRQYLIDIGLLVDNNTYTYAFDESTKTARLTGGNPQPTGFLVIPETATKDGITYSVTSIGTYAFQSCTGLTSVVIGSSVTSIGNYAFYNCTGLTSVSIPNSVTSIGTAAFYGCTGLKSVVIGNSVTSIGDNAFYNCTGLTSVVIGNSVTSIGNNAFQNCTGLTSVVIGNSVTSIGSEAFYGCTGLTSVIIPSRVTSIGDYAFLSCTGLTSVVIGSSVKSIGSQAFANCTGLTSVVIGNSVTSIGSYAFSGCTGLTSVVIGNSVTSIGTYAFISCTRLTSVVIPSSVTTIYNLSFWQCTSVTRVFYVGKKLPTYVTNYWYESFYSPFENNNVISYYLSTATSPKNLTSKQTIGTNTPISAAVMLTKLLEAGYTRQYIYSIGLFAPTITAPPNNPATTPVLISSISTVNNLADTSVIGTTTDEQRQFTADAVKSLFTANPTLSRLELPVGGALPGYAASLAQTLYIYNAPTTSTLQYSELQNKQFYISLESGETITMNTQSDSVTITKSGNTFTITIFSGNTTITKNIGDTYQYDGLDVILGSIYGTVQEPTYAYVFENQTFTFSITSQVTGTATILSSTMNSEGWVNIPETVTIGGSDNSGTINTDNSLTPPPFIYSVTGIAKDAFANSTTLKRMVIPNSVTRIEDSTFQNCTELATVWMGYGVTSIGTNAFQGCTRLNLVIIPINVTSIQSGAFSGCTAVTRVYYLQSTNLPTIADQNQFTNPELLSYYVSTVVNPDNLLLKQTTPQNSNRPVTLRDLVFMLVDAGLLIGDFQPNVKDPNYKMTTFGPDMELLARNVPSIEPGTTPVQISAISTLALNDTSVIGTTTALQRQFTAAAMRSLFAANTTQRRLILPAGSILPGFSTSTEQPLDLFNASASNGSITTITRDEISSRHFYILLEAGDSVVMETTSDSVTISKTGTIFTITKTSDESFTTAVVGERFIYDGLNVILGSVIGTFVPIPTVTPPSDDVIPPPAVLPVTEVHDILCFRGDGTTFITCLDPETKQEYECAVELMTPGLFVKTYKHGYIQVQKMAFKTILNPENEERIKNRLYTCSVTEYPELYRDLYITGCHSILESKISDEQIQATREILGHVYYTDDKIRLMAMCDDRAKPFCEAAEFKVWHVCLEHYDDEMNYGIYANGLLVESCSKRNLELGGGTPFPQTPMSPKT